MKYKFLLFVGTLVIWTVPLISSCKKSEGSGVSSTNTNNIFIPVLTTNPASNITTTSAQSGGIITSDGGSPVTARGVCWSVVTPTINDSKTNDGSGNGSFNSSIINLIPNTSYSVRAYATNIAGTGYGNVISVFTVLPVSTPTIVTSIASSINSNSAITGGNIISDGGSSISTKGVCWSTSPNPTTSNNVTIDGVGTGNFVSVMLNLLVNTTYYVRAYATNATGTGYGNEITVTTAYVIGESFGGGRIFYVDNSKLHGLIVSLSDQDGRFWAGTFISPNAFSTSDGKSNTDKIIALDGTSNAAGSCRLYNGGGYNDWYLPAIDELKTLYTQRSVMNNYTTAVYWSSTESSTYIGDAWGLDFTGSGSIENTYIKFYLIKSRAIRAF